jgi:hypothetical protein
MNAHAEQFGMRIAATASPARTKDYVIYRRNSSIQTLASAHAFHCVVKNLKNSTA